MLCLACVRDCLIAFSFTALAEWNLVESVLRNSYGTKFMLKFNCMGEKPQVTILTVTLYLIT